MTFTASINSNCSSISASDFSSFINGTSIKKCCVNKELFNNDTVNVACHPIENHARRHWIFNSGDLNGSILTLTIILKPLSLETSMPIVWI